MDKNITAPQYTTPCFIRKNTPELLSKLRYIGYLPLYEVCPINDMIVTELGGMFWDTVVDDGIDNSDGSFGIDCGVNEDLFIAIAALREDSDIHQWFTTDDCSEWYLCNTDTCGKKVESVNRWHKATPEELIEYFTKQ